ncbi:cell cycle checkpoint protein RAD17 [Osmerus mordax]|uniref:cell cycle checkpoint protein RAD17 n=1 Tax=Osmerus mordax TaxID=8014 RepID=UPI00350F7561
MSKLSLGGKGPSSKLNRWVEPSFGGLCGGGGLPTPPGSSRAESGRSQKGRAPTSDPIGSKRPRKRKVDPVRSDLQTPDPYSRDVAPRNQEEPWVDTHSPGSQAELVVHKKKIEEVENWITAHVDPKTFKGGAILLLSGPSGCGKSTTVRVLARELGVSLQEWTNPPSLAQHHPDAQKLTFDPHSRFSGFQGSSQTGLFQEFLLRADKYSRLQMNGEAGPTDRKLILVEDFPNQFYRQPACLHEVLKRFARTGRTALVFIVSDSLSGDGSSRLLFPKDLLEELSICSISFNPVAPTSMMKVMTRIVTLEAAKSGGRVSVPDRADLELLCSGSSGDVRSAINSLQFSSLTDQPQETGPWAGQKGRSVTSRERAVSTATGRKRRDSERQDQTIGGKDASLFLFRALGKILYCKRESWEGSELQPGLPPHLAEHHRDRLLVDPEGVLERCHMSGELFNLYLHQNYLDFFSEVEDVARASDYLSHADFLTAEWSSRSTLGAYGSSVATRGLLHANNAQVSTRFRPLHKPHWLQVNKKHQENCLAAQSLFISFCMTPVSLQTELLPHLALLSTPLRNQAQISFLEDVGRLPLRRGSGRLRLEALTDRDPGELQLDSDEEGPVSSTVNPPLGSVLGGAGEQDEPSMEVLLPDSQPQPSTSGALLEDDLLIEEYDSD